MVARGGAVAGDVKSSPTGPGFIAVVIKVSNRDFSVKKEGGAQCLEEIKQDRGEKARKQEGCAASAVKLKVMLSDQQFWKIAALETADRAMAA